jgi:acyl-CoA thioesterase
MSMVVKPEFLNGHSICHGGLMFTLADTAFAYACNSGNISTVASGCSIEFLKPVNVGDVLTATARVVLQSGRHGVYDIEVKNAANETVVLFRGKSAQIKGSVVEIEALGLK